MIVKKLLFPIAAYKNRIIQLCCINILLAWSSIAFAQHFDHLSDDELLDEYYENYYNDFEDGSHDYDIQGIREHMEWEYERNERREYYRHKRKREAKEDTIELPFGVIISFDKFKLYLSILCFVLLFSIITYRLKYDIERFELIIGFVYFLLAIPVFFATFSVITNSIINIPLVIFFYWGAIYLMDMLSGNKLID